jgi:manganese/zinc/iron transport system substrate-binding protein
VMLWRDCVLYMCSVLKKMDPQNADVYEKNTQIYIEKLEALHESIYNSLQKIPLSQRVLISAHDAFSYFGRAYDLEVKGLQGISTVSECGLRDVSDMTNLIISRKIRSIFLETSVPEGPINAVVEGCKQRGYGLEIGGHLYSDALGSLDSPQGTYIGMLKTNVETIVESLS